MQTYNEKEEIGEINYLIKTTANTYTYIHSKGDGWIHHVTVNTEGAVTRSEPVLAASPTTITMHRSPIEGFEDLYTITYDTPTGPFTVQEERPQVHVGFLRDRGLILNQNKAADTFNALLNNLIRDGRVCVREEMTRPGFYMARDGEPIKSKVDMHPPGEGEAGRCAELLEDIAFHFNDQSIFFTVVRWFLVAPFNYMRKQLGHEGYPYLYLYNQSRAGKTTMAKVAQWLYVDTPGRSHHIGGASFSTPARASDYFNAGTLPVTVNEPGEVFKYGGDVVEMLKSAADGLICRRAYSRGPMAPPVVTHSFMTPCFTSNHYLPDDEALIRRIYILFYSKRDLLCEEEWERFYRAFRPDASDSPCRVLRALGGYAWWRVSRDPGLLELGWERLSEEFLKDFYLLAGVSIPDFALKLAGDSGSDAAEESKESYQDMVRSLMVKDIAVAFRGNPDDFSYPEIVHDVVSRRAVPYLIRHSGNRRNGYAVTASFGSRFRGVYGQSLSLRMLSDLMGWEYTLIKSGGRALRVCFVDRGDFVEFLSPSLDGLEGGGGVDGDEGDEGDVGGGGVVP